MGFLTNSKEDTYLPFNVYKFSADVVSADNRAESFTISDAVAK